MVPPIPHVTTISHLEEWVHQGRAKSGAGHRTHLTDHAVAAAPPPAAAGAGAKLEAAQHNGVPAERCAATCGREPYRCGDRTIHVWRLNHTCVEAEPYMCGG
eukprot:360341-Chlamydomonas_euryale.AAC.11